MATIQDLGKVAYFNKGVYNSETSYEINDVVSYNGSSYVSLGNNNQGNLPTNTTYWSVVALKGEKGDTGKPFVIEKTYESIEDMVADYDNMNVNDYVMIQGNIEEEENATLWTKTETEVSPYKWVYLADFSGASGITGQTPNIQIGTVTEGNEPAVTRRAGSSNENPILDFVLKTGAKGDTGATGNGISNVSKTGTSDLTDTYTITYTNGNSTTFDVSNGKGIVSIVKTGTSGLVDTYTITYNDGTTSTYTVTNGEDGEVTQAQLDETNSEVELLKKIYNAFPTTSGEDEIVTLNGTAEVQFKNFELKCNTSQNTTTGKNLLNNTITSQTINNVVFTKYDDGTIAINGKANAQIVINIGSFKATDGTFMLSGMIPDGGEQLYKMDIYNPNGSPTTLATTYGNDISFTYTGSELTYNCRLVIRDGITINGILKPMIETGSSATSYEPFTNGASPNPDFPQPIEVVTGENDIKIEGKNLFKALTTPSASDKATYAKINDNSFSLSYTQSSATNNSAYVKIDFDISKLKTNTKYTLSKSQSVNGTSFTGIGSLRTRLNGVNGSVVNDNSITFTTPSVLENVGVYFYVAYQNVTTGNATITFDNIQLEEGETATTYTPYTSQSYQVNLGSMELCKIGDYKDRIYYSSGKWYLEKNIGKVVLNGSEEWRIWNNNLYIETLSGYNKNNNAFKPYCSHYKGLYSTVGTVPPGDIDNNSIRFGKNAVSDRLFVMDSRFTTANQFKEWLETNNITLYYVLATPTTTEITDTTLIGQLNDLERAYSYDEQTTISQTNSNKPFIINAEAILSLKNIFNS